MSNKKDAVKVRGFYRLNVVEGDKVVGDSGWVENQVVNLGFQDYLIHNFVGSSAGSKKVTHVALGTGTAPGATATALNGEIANGAASDHRHAVTTSVSQSKTARFTATFASADSFVSATATIQNIGLFNTSTEATGTLFSGNTYATSTVATNQNVNITYDIQFS